MSFIYQTSGVTSTLDKDAPCLTKAIIVKKNMWFHKKAEGNKEK